MREISLKILGEIRRNESFLAQQFEKEFKNRRNLDERIKGKVVRQVQSVFKSQRFLHFALEHGEADNLSGEERDLALILSWEVLNERLRPAEAQQILKKVSWETLGEVREREEWLELSEVEKIAIEYSLHDELVSKWIELFGVDRTRDILKYFDRTPLQILRVNTQKTHPADLLAQFRDLNIDCEVTPYSDSGLILKKYTNLFKLPAFHEGLFEIQDEGSQLIGELVDPLPKSQVVDACCGRGGKALHLADLLKARGQVIAFDLPSSQWKLKELKRRAKRAGHQNIQMELLSPEGELPEKFNSLIGKTKRVLLDVPCSGSGVLGRKPEARGKIDTKYIEELSQLQLKILNRFCSLVSPGGRLIYSTCSLLPQENEIVIRSFLEAHSEFKVLPFEKTRLGERLPQLITKGDPYLRLFPDWHRTDGFFAAVLVRRPD